MSELDTFRMDARTWLEANCPAEMRTPMKSDKDACWGGRNLRDCSFTGNEAYQCA